MASTILLVLVAAVLYAIISNVVALRKNIALARRSGIHYILTPVYFLNIFWLLGHRLVLRYLKKLPSSWTYWVDFSLPDFSYQYGYSVFARVGHETFMVVAPGGITMYTCEAEVINQITTRRNDFPKPTKIYESLDIYGKNILTTEKEAWRKHRKATSPPFTEKNNHLVWKEAIRQAQAMLNSWVGRDGKGGKTVDRVMDDTMRISLHVISTASFGRSMEWPNEDADKLADGAGFVDDSKIKNESKDLDPGHKMSYTYALHCLLDTALLQFLVPKWLLKWVPMQKAKKAVTAYDEWGNYMRELLMQRKQDLEAGGAVSERNDILTQLVKQQIVDVSDKTKNQLTEQEVLGNMFLLILAGHETAANSIYHSILYLALFPESQRRLQVDLDRIFQGTPPDEWDYDRDLPALFGGMVGAVLAEQLRLISPVPSIPKSTMEGAGEQRLFVKGKQCLVPADTYIAVCIAPAQKNPNTWPLSKATLPGGRPAHPVSNIENDLEEFRPERWLLSTSGANDAVSNKGIPGEKFAEAEDGLNVNETEDISDKLYKPIKGSYLPFSEGFRSCLGRRFAQVEILATLSVLFQEYSVELDVSKYADDARLLSMDPTQRAEVWDKAAEDARELVLNQMGIIFTLQIQNGKLSLPGTSLYANYSGTIPFRFVRRGKEKFPDNVDEIFKKAHPEKISAQGQPEWRYWHKSKRRPTN